MNVLWIFALLRLLADALKAGDARSAGQELDRELDGVVQWFGGLLKGACGCYLAWIAICIVGGIVATIWDIIVWRLGGR